MPNVSAQIFVLLYFNFLETLKIFKELDNIFDKKR